MKLLKEIKYSTEEDCDRVTVELDMTRTAWELLQGYICVSGYFREITRPDSSMTLSRKILSHYHEEPGR
jgi:hypothetical protein